ncbi:MAG TPA: NAD(P)/FAD-dependent oxidoreductase [Ilumatobacteraceae bacterium]|nr:NAD(P)/FAD-dependent oxidoreductase [Ilumatobacteraceae bacterium]
MTTSATHVPTVIVGAGHAGLAMSRRLTERAIEHIVLERGEVANSWRTERWESLRLLTPNWQCQLPGMRYSGHDPDGFMTMADVADFITTYAATISAPVSTGTTVTRIARHGRGYLVETNREHWTCSSVVIASGGSNIANVPDAATEVPTAIAQVTPLTYRSPSDLDDRAVLVVGASATGVQLADEINRSGRSVTIAVGEHVRMPRNYRGRDVFWWMHQTGVLDEGLDDVDDIVRARHLPSPQLIGTHEHRSIDLNTLTERGVEMVGRLGLISEGVAKFSGSLANVCKLADLKMNRLLDRFDDWSDAATIADLDPPTRFDATRVPSTARLDIDLVEDDIGTIVWATGFRPDYSWLDVPVLDHRGRIRHDGGVTDAPGLYVIGLNVLRRRRSSYINGAERDSEELSALVARHLDATNRVGDASLDTTGTSQHAGIT